MNLRLTLTAAAAVVLASVSLYPLIQGGEWFWAGVGGVIAAAAAGIITRLSAFDTAVAAPVTILAGARLMFTDAAWSWRAARSAFVAAAAMSRPRIRIAHVLAYLATYLAALLIYLNAAFAGRLSAAGLTPTRASLHHLWMLAGQGFGERTARPPVPGTPGVLLLAAGGIGLVAVAADMLAVRLHSTAVAGLPLLAPHIIPIVTTARQGGLGAAVVFCLGATGYLALLSAGRRQRLQGWGLLVTTAWRKATVEQTEPLDTTALAASGRRIGLAAMCIALALTVIVPSVRVHRLWEASRGPGAGPSKDQIPPLRPLVQMQAQLRATTPRTVLTYRTTAAQPQYQYLQVYVLNYSSSTGSWSLVPPGASTPVSSRSLKIPPGLAATTPVTSATTHVRFSEETAGYDSGWSFLPLPYAPSTLRVAGSWREDDTTLMVYSPQSHLSSLTYTVTSTQVIPASRQQELPPAFPLNISASYLDFPAGRDRQLAKLAAKITGQARTSYQKALALQRYFLTPGRFTYGVGVHLPGGIAGLTEFLTKTKRGDCQQFAFAMAALARLVGIPSRIAVGYTAGTSEGNGTWKVTTADAHAWPELYFRDVGWLRFEPTPGGPAGQGTATQPVYAPPPGLAAPAGSQKPLLNRVPGREQPGTRFGSRFGHLNHLSPTGVTGAAPLAGPRRNLAFPILLLALTLLGLIAITPVTARSLTRFGRLRAAGDASLAHATWRELRDNLADYGFGYRASESSRALAGRVAATLHLDPMTRQALDRIASAEERASYDAAPADTATLRADTAVVRRALARDAGWTTRWRARLLPASTLTSIRSRLQHALHR